MKSRQVNALLAITIISSPITALSATKHETKHYGLHSPFQIQDLAEGTIKEKLTNLPRAKKQKALDHLHKIDFTDEDLKYLQIDNEGGVLYADSFLPASGVTAPAQQAMVISATDAFTLHSKPGAAKVIYLDFDGHVITGTAWNSTVSSYKAKAFDTDGNIGAFSATELSQIAEVWHRIAEDYAPFNVDVTTELPAAFGPTVGRILITHNVDANGVNMPAFGSGGVAYVGVWGASNYGYYSPALVYYNALGNGYAPYVSEAASHEMGHNLGLSHDGFNDGTTSLGYFAGNGTGFVSWAPIMGVGYYNNVTQWSKGEYAFATQTQDDIGIIAGQLALRADDHSNVSLGATPLLVSSTGQITASNPETDPHNANTSNKGVIENRTDVDVFSVDAGAGTLDLHVTPAWEAFYRTSTRGADLDIQLTLYDQNGVQIAQTDPTTETDATITTTVAAGRYYLEVSGVGNAVTIYSDYGSLGQYFIAGAVAPSTLVDSTPPLPSTMSWIAVPNAQGSANSITMQATVATDASGVVQYNFVCVAGGSNCVNSGWQTLNTYTATGLQAGTSYSYNVQARDMYGNQNIVSSTESATTAASVVLAPKAPTNLTGSKNKTLKTVNLKWTASTGATGYNIYRCSEVTLKRKTSCTYATTPSGTATTNTFSEAIPSTTVRYKVKALNNGGISAFSNEIRI